MIIHKDASFTLEVVFPLYINMLTVEQLRCIRLMSIQHDRHRMVFLQENLTATSVEKLLYDIKTTIGTSETKPRISQRKILTTPYLMYYT